MKYIEIANAFKVFFAYKYFGAKRENIVLVYADESSTLNAYKQLKFLLGKRSDNELLYFPSKDVLPYDRISPSTKISAERARVLSVLSNSKSAKIIVTNAANLIVKLPSPEIFKDEVLKIKVGENIDRERLINFLFKAGYNRTATAFDVGDFAIKGEIVDIVCSQYKAYRINNAWDKIVSMRLYDVNSQLSGNSVDNITIMPASEILHHQQMIANFKSNFLKVFGVNHINSEIYQAIIAGQKFHGYEQLIPLFYDTMVEIYDYLNNYVVIYDSLVLQSMKETSYQYQEYYQSRVDANKINKEFFYFALLPENKIDDVEKQIRVFNNNKLTVSDETIGEYSSINLGETLKKENKTIAQKLFLIINEYKEKVPVIFCSSISNLKKIEYFVKEAKLTPNKITSFDQIKNNQINITATFLSENIISDNYLYIADYVFLGSEFKPQGYNKTKRQIKKILLETDGIKEGQLIVHKNYGIGRFIKIEPIKVDNVNHDCLKIIYADDDILYLPVENIELVKKYGDGEAILD